MTPAERAELKRVAEAANDDKGVGGLQKILATRAGAKHINTFNPETVLRLLADVERLERALRRLVGHVSEHNALDYPEMPHVGACGPEAGCDGNCMEVSYMAEHDAAIREARAALGGE